MIRNLKALGLALVAMFAMSAVVASAASAQQGFLTSDGPVTLTAEDTEGPGEDETNALTAFGSIVECGEATYTGHAYNVTPHQFIKPPATTTTLKPNYKNCIISGLTLPVTVDMNECDYVVHLGQTTGGANTYGVTFDLVCPPGKEVTVTNWFSKAAHEGGAEACTIHIPPQNNLGGPVHVTDTTNGHIDILGTIEGIKATKTKDNSHPILCPHGTTENAKLDIDVTVSGHNELGENTDITISE